MPGLIVLTGSIRRMVVNFPITGKITGFFSRVTRKPDGSPVLASTMHQNRELTGNKSADSSRESPRLLHPNKPNTGLSGSPSLLGISAADSHPSNRKSGACRGTRKTKPNANGQRGIENAEAKQSRDRDDSGKKLAKGKSKGKKHGHGKGHSK
jgi:hypothetical protein